jgi:NTP pyrophosphatase (non-canonical NTP hydrolase)
MKKEKVIWFNDKQQISSSIIKSYALRQQLTDSLNNGVLPFITEAAIGVHEANVKKGFYDEKDRNKAELLMLIVSEVVEVLEALRAGRKANLKAYDAEAPVTFDPKVFEDYIKDTEEDEVADCIIRLLDYAGYRGIDLQRHINLKLEYNLSRPQKHGKKF